MSLVLSGPVVSVGSGILRGWETSRQVSRETTKVDNWLWVLQTLTSVLRRVKGSCGSWGRRHGRSSRSEGRKNVVSEGVRSGLTHIDQPPFVRYTDVRSTFPQSLNQKSKRQRSHVLPSDLPYPYTRVDSVCPWLKRKCLRLWFHVSQRRKVRET